MEQVDLDERRQRVPVPEGLTEPTVRQVRETGMCCGDGGGGAE